MKIQNERIDSEVAVFAAALACDAILPEDF